MRDFLAIIIILFISWVLLFFAGFNILERLAIIIPYLLAFFVIKKAQGRKKENE